MDRHREAARPMGWPALAIWTVATILGVPIVYFLPQMVLALVDVYDWVGILIYVLVGALCGALAGLIVGVLQQGVLPQVPWARHWLRATVLGWALGGGILWLLSRMLIFADPTNPSAFNAFIAVEIIGALSGAGIGLGQALTVKQPRQRVWWILTSAGAWAAGSAVALGGGQTPEPIARSLDPLLGIILIFTLIGVTAGLLTGFAMNRLISQHTEQPQRSA